MNELIFALVLLLYMATRQLTARPVKRNLYTLPILGLGYGAFVAYGQGAQGAENIALLILIVLGIAAGWMQGRYIRVFERNGVWMIAGSTASVAIWLLSLPLRAAVHFGFEALCGIQPVLTGSYAFVPFLLSIAGMMLGRALRLTALYPEEMMAGTTMSRRERRRLS